MLRRLFLLVLAFVSLPAAAQPRAPRPPVTVLVSIDGFRYDYLARGLTPRLTALAADGVRAPLVVSFPSLTFPNHWTLVTGLRPDRNGIVGNSFEDPRRLGELFTLAASDPFWWSEAEPLWITAERQGVRTATMFWPGSNVAFGPTRPHDWWPYAKEVSERQRVEAVLDWLRRPPGERPRFITLYFDSVDTAGHAHGPDSPEVNAALQATDALIGRLVDGAAALGQPFNLVVTSDHGMAQTAPERVILLDRLADGRDFRTVAQGPYAAIELRPGGDRARLEAALLRSHEHLRCWRKGELPAAFHYGRNPRAPSYLCLADLGWIVLPTAPEPGKPAYAVGAHGYDPAEPLMRALFIAHGPAFARGAVLPPVANVDVYPLLARLIGVRVPPGDGTLSPFETILR